MSTYDPNADYGESNEGGGVLPLGKHCVAIIEAESKTSSNGNAMAEIGFKCIAGKSIGGVIRFNNFMLHTDKSFKWYALLARAVKAPGHDPKDDSDLKKALLGKVLMVNIVVKPGNNGYEASVRVKQTTALNDKQIASLHKMYGDDLAPLDELFPDGKPTGDSSGGSDDSNDDDDIPW